MPTITNPALAIDRVADEYTISVSCDIDWWAQELEFPSLFYAVIGFRGQDDAFRGGDDRLFTMYRPVLGPRDLRDTRPARYEEEIVLSRLEFSLDEDKGPRRRGTDEIYVNMHLEPAELFASNTLRSGVVTGHF